VAAEDIEDRGWAAIFAPAPVAKRISPEPGPALFTVSGDFSTIGTVGKTRLVEFADDQGP